jgi:hypothetical protein
MLRPHTTKILKRQETEKKHKTIVVVIDIDIYTIVQKNCTLTLVIRILYNTSLYFTAYC